MNAPIAETAHNLATIRSRVLASIIDFTIALAAFALAAWLIGSSSVSALTIVAIAISAVMFLTLVIYQITILSSRGQTIGKQIMDIRIINFVDAGNPGFGRAVLMRAGLLSLIYPIPYLGPVFWLGNVLCLFKHDHRCLHDLMAGTTVIQLTDQEAQFLRNQHQSLPSPKTPTDPLPDASAGVRRS